MARTTASNLLLKSNEAAAQLQISVSAGQVLNIALKNSYVSRERSHLLEKYEQL